MISRDYREPTLLSVQARPPRKPDDRVTRWVRRYDNIEVRADAVTSHAEAWHTRFYPEEQEPPRVRRDKLLGESNALKRSKLDAHGAEVDLVYMPHYTQRQKPGTRGDNAMDWEHLIDRHNVVYVVRDREHVEVFIDAYLGTNVGGTTPWVH